MATSAAVDTTEIVNPDVKAIKAYIQAQDGAAFTAVDPDIVVLDLTHSNLQQRHVEIRFYKQDALETLRLRIYRQTGTPPADQHLRVYEGSVLVADIPADTDDSLPLGRFGLVHHGMRVHCTDMNPHSGSAGGAYEDVTLVEKFRLTEEQYAKKAGTLRSWAAEQKLKNPNFTLQQHATDHLALVEAQRAHRLGLALPEGFFLDSAGKVVREEPDVVAPPVAADQDGEYGEMTVSHAKVGQRCQVSPGERRGAVAYVGKLPEIGTAWWVGVVLDEPSGQNNGTFEGKHYFETPGPRYGCVVRGRHVDVGDYPERDWLEDSEDEL
jgi:tubulin-folding cofactor B